MKYILVFLFLVLAGCSTLDSLCADRIGSPKVVHIDPRSLVDCKDQVLLTSPTFDEVLNVTSQNTKIYIECKDLQHNSILLIKKLANIKD